MDGSSTGTRSSSVLDASRRVTACIPCQKQKVRCAIEDGRPPCRRCKNRQMACIFKKPFPSAGPPETASQAVVHDLKMLHSAVNELRARSAHTLLGPLRSARDYTKLSQDWNTIMEISEREAPTVLPRAELDSQDIDTEMLVERSRRPSYTGGLSLAPITSLYQITRLRSLRSQGLLASSTQASEPSKAPIDLISRGILDWSDADRLTRAFLKTPDHYLYGVASKYEDLESIRRASSLLLVAICTVSASQEPSGATLYRICHAELRRLVSNFVFTSQVDLEDFRGLCITCFWLSDISWSVSGLAIRRAIEFELPKSFYLVVNSAPCKSDSPPSSEAALRDIAIERVRLWYLFYVCDQHLSILYGRIPTIRDQESIREWESYLAAVPDSAPDLRITSQIALLRILNSVSELFGLDIGSRIPTVFKPQLDRFNDKLDHWVTLWLGRCRKHPHIGDYPSKAVTLHFYFAKLLVCSHVFRGISSDVTIDPIPLVFQDTAHVAVESAKSIIYLVVEDSDLTAAFFGVPHYFHTMIAFACSFLLKTATKYRQHVEIDVKAVFEMIGRVVALCKNTHCTQFHLIHWIGEGLQILLSSCVNATPDTEVDWNQAGTQQFDTNEPFLPMPNTTTHHSGTDYVTGTRQSRGSVWDAACQAAMVYSTDHSTLGWDYSQSTERPVEMIGYSMNGLGHADFTGTQWDTSMNYTNMEHFGLGLGIL